MEFELFLIKIIIIEFIIGCQATTTTTVAAAVIITTIITAIMLVYFKDRAIFMS
jgi:hypothetical protein